VVQAEVYVKSYEEAGIRIEDREKEDTRRLGDEEKVEF
jgi:hypothetical protein